MATNWPQFPEESIPTEFSWGWIKWAALLVLLAAGYFAVKQFESDPNARREPLTLKPRALVASAILEKLLADSATLPPVTIVENYSAISPVLTQTLPSPYSRHDVAGAYAYRTILGKMG
jgi:hypothetical protein